MFLVKNVFKVKATSVLNAKMAYTFTKENVKLLALQAHFTVLCKKYVSLATKNAKVVSAQIKNNA